MRCLITVSTCLVTLALHSAAWAQIYETKDAQGNPVFTDAPVNPSSEAINLPQTNIIDAPQGQPPQEQPTDTVAEEPASPQVDSNTVIIPDDNAGEEAYDEYLRRERAFDREDPAAPRQTLDGEAPRQVGDYNGQMPREVGDTNAQMPREVGDTNAQMPREVGDSSSQMPDQVGDTDAQMPREVGDFPAGGGAEQRR
ncbi:MAG: DUF4124 domain-containing protein [Halioglobus sp.]